jgi:hypothetical protein
MLGTKLCDGCWELETRIKDDPKIARKILDTVEDQIWDKIKLTESPIEEDKKYILQEPNCLGYIMPGWRIKKMAFTMNKSEAMVWTGGMMRVMKHWWKNKYTPIEV